MKPLFTEREIRGVAIFLPLALLALGVALLARPRTDAGAAREAETNQRHATRRDTLRRYAQDIGLELREEDVYGLRQFTAAVAGDSDHRCGYCYACRLERTARYAAENGFCRFSTTLLVSPYQNRELIRAAGERMGEKYGVEFAAYDFRPRFQEGQEEARAAGLYLQKYCGCVYSEEERFSNRRKKELHKLHKAEGRASQC